MSSSLPTEVYSTGSPDRDLCIRKVLCHYVRKESAYPSALLDVPW